MVEEEGVEVEVGRGSAVKKGLLWQQRDRLFSRWKERFFILTTDYFHCFRRVQEAGADTDNAEEDDDADPDAEMTAAILILVDSQERVPQAGYRDGRVHIQGGYHQIGK